MSGILHRGLVSTIIPVFNRGALLKEAVESVLGQTYQSIEIIIVNDGSTDDTGAVVDNLMRQNPGKIKAIHIPNLGAGMARERGRLIASGEFIQYLDSDDLLLPEKFSVQVAALRRRPDCGIGYGYTRLVDCNKYVLKAPFKWTGMKMETLFPALLVDRWWNTHTPLFRRSVCDVVGPWSNMRMSEDWEYEARIGALGIRLVHCPQYLSDTRQHTGNRVTGGTSETAHCGDMVRLIETLYSCAIKAGVDRGCSEMRHFSRWAFLESRRAGAAGLVDESKGCYGIAVKAAGGRLDYQLNLYRALTRLIGWGLAGRLSITANRLFRHTPGPDTRPLSWKDS